MKKLIKSWLYPIVTEIFRELLHKQAHNSILYRLTDQKVKILNNNFFEEILKNERNLGGSPQENKRIRKRA